MTIIVDYGMGNLGSILNMIKKLGHHGEITRDKKKILQATKLILPGVGSFDKAIYNIRDLKIYEPIKKRIEQDKVPTLGICLGMQLMMERSEEGKENGFGFFDGEVVKFNLTTSSKLKIPHMGWNYISIKKEHQLLENLSDLSRFYFVHSYHVMCSDNQDILATTKYGYEFVSAVSKNNILGVQFHPEKSHKFGLQLIRNFLNK